MFYWIDPPQKTVKNGDIGEDQKEYEFEPMPETAPVEQPVVAPEPAQEPEKVPA